jgi:methylated-DNA-protein-cysteine methyltransferase-like protein
MKANPELEHLYPRIYDVIRQIPSGRAATYGQIAAIVGPPVDARTVGWALASLRAASDVPWQRVINSQGKISFRKHTTGHDRQRMRLEAEGVEFDARDRIDLNKYGWAGPDPAWLVEHGYPPPGEATNGEEQPLLL